MITEDSAEPLEAIVVDADGARPATTVIAWIGVGLVIFLLVWWVWTRWINPSAGGTITRYMNGAGVLFEDPNDQFRVTTPTQWKRSTDQNEFGTIVTVSDSVGSDYSFTVTKTPQPESALASYKSSLNQIAGQLASQSGATIISQTEPTPIQDVAVKDVVYRKGDAQWHARIELLKDRVYTVIAKSPGDDQKVFDHFVTTFQPLSPR